MKNKTKREREQNYIIGMITTKKTKNKISFLHFVCMCLCKNKIQKITLILLLYNTNKKNISLKIIFLFFTSSIDLPT